MVSVRMYLSQSLRFPRPLTVESALTPAAQLPINQAGNPNTCLAVVDGLPLDHNIPRVEVGVCHDQAVVLLPRRPDHLRPKGGRSVPLTQKVIELGLVRNWSLAHACLPSPVLANS